MAKTHLSESQTEITFKKYWQTFKIAWENGFVYRTSLALWRIRQVLSTVMILTIWTVVFGNGQSIGDYTQSQMITYIFVAAIIQNFVFASILNGLAGDVYSGQLSYEMLRPVNIFGYLAMKDVADKLKNVVFVLIEMAALAYVFQPALIIPQALTFLSVVVMVLMGIVLNFIITLLFGAIGFWSPDAWGPRFLFFMILEFSSGRTFPLDILPKIAQDILYLSPFPYLSFIQTQVFLGRITGTDIITNFGILFFWILGLGMFTGWIWKLGFRNYDAAGR